MLRLIAALEASLRAFWRTTLSPRPASWANCFRRTAEDEAGRFRFARSDEDCAPAGLRPCSRYVADALFGRLCDLDANRVRRRRSGDSAHVRAGSPIVRKHNGEPDLTPSRNTRFGLFPPRLPAEASKAPLATRRVQWRKTLAGNDE